MSEASISSQVSLRTAEAVQLACTPALGGKPVWKRFCAVKRLLSPPAIHRPNATQRVSLLFCACLSLETYFRDCCLGSKRHFENIIRVALS